VAYILEGSVRRAGHTVRVTGQLIDARTDEHVWAKSYDRDLSDVFAIQSELAQAIATALQAALSPQEKTLIGRRPTDNPAAYDLYLKARQQWQSGAQALTATEPLLREAVQLDPKFAAAWADLAARQAFAYFNDQDHTAGRLAGAKQAIDEAVRLAPDDPEVIEGLGDYYYYAYRDYPRATEQYLRLAQLRPNDPVMYFSLALIYRRQGRWADALPNFRRAVELDPTNLNYGIQFIQLLTALRHYDEAEDLARHWVQAIPQEIEPAWYLSSVRFFARGSTAGLDEFTRQSFAPPQAGWLDFFRKSNACLRGDFGEAIRLDRQHPYFDGFGEPHWSQDVGAAFVLAVHGDTAEARARAEQAIPSMKAELEKQPASAGLWLGLSGAYTLLGDKAQALRAGQKAMELVPESADAVAGPIYSLNLASSLAYLGEKDRALAELARLLRTPYGENIYVAKYSPAWYPLHGDRRFEALVNDPANNAPLF
jgi:tetratricopeptide (TPR) repeat protein